MASAFDADTPRFRDMEFTRSGSGYKSDRHRKIYEDAYQQYENEKYRPFESPFEDPHPHFTAFFEEEVEIEREPCQDTFGLRKSKSQDELRKRYRKMCLKHHPDKGGDSQLFIQLRKEYEHVSETFYPSNI